MIIAKNFNIDGVQAKPYLKISLTLKKVGIRRHYKGYPRMAYAIYLVMEDESRLEAMMKEVYMPVAEKYNCSWESVERSMRSLRDMIWKNYREQLCAMTGFKLKEPPQESYLLEIFATYIKHGNLDQALQGLEGEGE